MLRVYDEGATVRLSLARPERHNALDPPLIEALTAALRGLGAAVRLVILEGEGKSFCAGADLQSMRHGGSLPRAANLAEA
ncbi:MAG: enoyl-CoA hydratase, partial [Deltaproteobacteria bacterium]